MLSLTLCKAQVDVTMYSTPIVLTAMTQGASDSYDIDFENNGIPDLRIKLNYYNGTGIIRSQANAINSQDIELDCLYDKAVAYNCSAPLGSGTDWKSQCYLGSSGYDTFYEGAGPKYLGFRKYSHTSTTIGVQDWYFYGWVKLEVSADGRTVTIFGFGKGTYPIKESSSPNVYAGQGDCDVSVREHTLPADVVNVLGNTVQVKSEEPVSIELFDLSGKLLFTESKSGGNAIFQLPGTNSIVLLRVTAGIKSRTLKIKL